jgi:hypothetical protein
MTDMAELNEDEQSKLSYFLMGLLENRGITPPIESNMFLDATLSDLEEAIFTYIKDVKQHTDANKEEE